MRIGMNIVSDLTDEDARFTKQLGVDDVLIARPAIPTEHRWEYEDLRRLREQCEAQGLRLEAIELLPYSFFENARLGLPGRDQEIEHCQATIRNLGRAGIPILGYSWMPNGIWRTSYQSPSRGGALVERFDYALIKDVPFSHGRAFTESEMWDAYGYFMRAIVPVAEEAGVRLALHPDDPPVPMIAGMPRIFHSVEGLARAIDLVPSPVNGLRLCQGCIAEMCLDVDAAIRRFGSLNKIFYVHFRDVRGTAEAFEETFIDDGATNMLSAMYAYQESGFDGCFTTDHVPHLEGDTAWGHRAQAYSIGYIRGLLDTVRQMPAGRLPRSPRSS